MDIIKNASIEVFINCIVIIYRMVVVSTDIVIADCLFFENKILKSMSRIGSNNIKGNANISRCDCTT